MCPCVCVCVFLFCRARARSRRVGRETTLHTIIHSCVHALVRRGAAVGAQGDPLVPYDALAVRLSLIPAFIARVPSALYDPVTIAGTIEGLALDGDPAAGLSFFRDAQMKHLWDMWDVGAALVRTTVEHKRLFEILHEYYDDFPPGDWAYLSTEIAAGRRVPLLLFSVARDANYKFYPPPEHLKRRFFASRAEPPGVANLFCVVCEKECAAGDTCGAVLNTGVVCGNICRHFTCGGGSGDATRCRYHDEMFVRLCGNSPGRRVFTTKRVLYDYTLMLLDSAGADMSDAEAAYNDQARPIHVGAYRTVRNQGSRTAATDAPHSENAWWVGSVPGAGDVCLAAKRAATISLRFSVLHSAHPISRDGGGGAATLSKTGAVRRGGGA